MNYLMRCRQPKEGGMLRTEGVVIVYRSVETDGEWQLCRYPAFRGVSQPFQVSLAGCWLGKCRLSLTRRRTVRTPQARPSCGRLRLPLSCVRGCRCNMLQPITGLDLGWLGERLFGHMDRPDATPRHFNAPFFYKHVTAICCVVLLKLTAARLAFLCFSDNSMRLSSLISDSQPLTI